jgi:hypothetical protein
MKLETGQNSEVRLQGYKRIDITLSDTVDILGGKGVTLYCNGDMTLNLLLIGDTTPAIWKLSKGFQPLLVKRVYLTSTDLDSESLFGII